MAKITRVSKVVKVGGEYQVKAWTGVDGKTRFPEGDYYTNDRKDALETAGLMVGMDQGFKAGSTHAAVTAMETEYKTTYVARLEGEQTIMVTLEDGREVRVSADGKVELFAADWWKDALPPTVLNKPDPKEGDMPTYKFVVLEKWFDDGVTMKEFTDKKDALAHAEYRATSMNGMKPLDQHFDRADRNNEGSVFMVLDTDEEGEPIRQPGVTDREWEAAEDLFHGDFNCGATVRLYDCDGIVAYVRVLEVMISAEPM